MNKNIQDSSLGKKLEEARKNLKLSVQDIASQLYLHEDVVLKMESDSYATGLDVYSRGYLYNYAKAVRLPTSIVDEAIANWGTQKPVKVATQVPESKPVPKPISKKKSHSYGAVSMRVIRAIFSVKNPVRWASYIVVGLLVALMIVWHVNHRGADTDLFAQEKAELEAAASNIVSSPLVPEAKSTPTNASPNATTPPHLFLAPSSER